MRLEPAFDREPLDPQDFFGAAARQYAVQRIEHVGRPKAARERFAQAQRRQNGARRRIGGDDVSLGVDDENRLRQRVDHRAEQRLVLPGLGALAHAA